MNFNENVFMKRRNRGTVRSRNKNQSVISVQRAQRNEGGSVYKTGSNGSTSNSVTRSNQKSDTPYQTSTSKTYSDADSRTILAVTEGRGQASCEIGIAAIDLNRPSIILCQFADTQSYINTLTKINILNAIEILVPNTFVASANNRLLDKIKEQFKNVNITAVPRSTFNNSNGLQAIKKICLTEFNSVTLIIQHRFYALTAAAALLNYIENVLNVIYACNSLKIEYQESEGYAIIDISTADNLELVASTCENVNNSRFSSLFGVLNHCLTKIGARTLRSAILQPLCNAPDIESRLDCVEELVNDYHMLSSVQTILAKLTNVDQILSLSNVVARTDNNGESQLNYTLLLNCLLELIVPLKDVFENSLQPFFVELRNILEDAAFLKITALLRMLIQEDAHPGKGSHGITQRCFAIKYGINGLLDNVRKSYTDRIEDLRDYVKKLGEKHNLPITLQNNNRNGYHLYLKLPSVQSRSFKKSDLPSEYIYVERLSSGFILKTEELVNKSTRIDDILTEILKISKKIVHSTLLEIKQHIPLFYKLCELIAKLDMYQALAQASKDGSYVRPKFREIMKITQSRHPLLEYLCTSPPVPNDVSTSKCKNLTIITGPNGSGKSIYIRQILMLQVMAQIGCFVPAQSAIFRISDRILARVFLEDSLDNGASTFVLELKEMQCFMNIMTPNTLMIVDEFARSTGEGEGTALAAAVAEKLASTNAFVFFTTHYKFLTKLGDMYYNIQNLHLDTSEEESERGILLKYTYNIRPGVCNLEKYGISLARIFWPEAITNEAENILKSFKEHTMWTTITEVIDKPKRLKYELETNLYVLKEEGRLNATTINEQLRKYETSLLSIGYNVQISPFTEITEEARRPDTDNELFQSRIMNVNDDSLNENYYIHPEIVYSPNREEITIQLPNESYYGSPNNLCDLTLTLNEEHVNNVTMQNSYKLDTLLEEDHEEFEEFSRNFDDNSITEQINKSLWNLLPLQNVLEEINVENINDNKNPCPRGTYESSTTDSTDYSLIPNNKRDNNYKKFSLRRSNLRNDAGPSHQEEKSINEQSFFYHLKSDNCMSSTPLDENNLNSSKINVRTINFNENPFDDTNITEVLQCLRPSESSENDSGPKEGTSNDMESDTSKNQTNNASIVAQKGSDSSHSLSDFSDQKHSSNIRHEMKETLPTCSKNVTKKKKTVFKTPLKECDLERFGVMKSYNGKSTKAIRKELEEQSNEIFESCNSSEDISKFMNYIEHRPTVEQMKQVTTVALIHKTEDGVVVMPPPVQTKRRKRKFETPLKGPDNLTNFRVSFLSDENSESFEKMLQSKAKVPIHEVCVISETSVKRQKKDTSAESMYIGEDHKDVDIEVVTHVHRSEVICPGSSEMNNLIKKYSSNPFIHKSSSADAETE